MHPFALFTRFFGMSSSKLPIYSALIANFLIAVTKFIAAFASGSSAMISEGIHSLVDTSNEVLLLYGIKRSQKPASRERPFGYGKELYFWAFIVSILIFGLGGGISFYEGVTHIQHPEELRDPFWNYLVLAFAVVFDGISFFTAIKEFNRQRATTPFWQAVKQSRDPSTFVVLFEDAADVLGLMVAFAGVFLSHYYQNPIFDGIASIVIGFILTAISVLLARESRSLLMGETAEPELLEAVVNLVSRDEAVIGVKSPLTMYMAPEEIIMVLKIIFKERLTTDKIHQAIERIKILVQDQYPTVKQIFIEPDYPKIATRKTIEETQGPNLKIIKNLP
jgi:cation diffusion facilitator family transporter